MHAYVCMCLNIFVCGNIFVCAECVLMCECVCICVRNECIYIVVFCFLVLLMVKGVTRENVMIFLQQKSLNLDQL